jgi:hypothetical protein
MGADVQEPRRRLSLTKRQIATEAGQDLLTVLTDIAGDGNLAPAELERLRSWLDAARDVEFPAVRQLRDLAEDILSDGVATDDECSEMLLLVERVLPVTERALVREARFERTRSSPSVGTNESGGDAPWGDWRTDSATDAQRRYVGVLGGSLAADATKGQASDLIEALLRQAKPPTPRQLMVFRFWGMEVQEGWSRLDATEWMDQFYEEDPERLAAWELYKNDVLDDERQGDPSRVPVGVGQQYLDRIKGGGGIVRQDPARFETPAAIPTPRSSRP